MKKLLSTFLLTGLISFAAFAQTETRIGGLLGFGSEIESLGIGGIAEFMINDNMGISPSVVVFFGKNEGDVKSSMWEINGNLNYYFDVDGIDLYGLGGLNIASISVKYDGPFIPGFPGFTSSATEVGLNLGLGANFQTAKDNLLPFAEIKYVISNFDQLCIFAGIKVVL